MRRGEIWTVAGGKDYAGKPRPVVILQDDHFHATASIRIRAFTTDPTEAALFRLPIEPNTTDGLRTHCRLTTRSRRFRKRRSALRSSASMTKMSYD